MFYVNQVCLKMVQKLPSTDTFSLSERKKILAGVLYVWGSFTSVISENLFFYNLWICLSVLLYSRKIHIKPINMCTLYPVSLALTI